MENPIYSTGYDHDVKAVVLYADGNYVLHKTSEMNDDDIVGKEEAVDLYMKGLMVICSNYAINPNYMRPIECEPRWNNEDYAAMFITRSHTYYSVGMRD